MIRRPPRSTLFPYTTALPISMQEVLARVDAPDLVAADHGFAGAAVAVDVPTGAIMDTNYPALAGSARRGAGLTVGDWESPPLNSRPAHISFVVFFFEKKKQTI